MKWDRLFVYVPFLFRGHGVWRVWECIRPILARWLDDCLKDFVSKSTIIKGFYILVNPRNPKTPPFCGYLEDRKTYKTPRNRNTTGSWKPFKPFPSGGSKDS